MSPVVVGYVPTPEGRAALTHGLSEARLRQARLVVVSSHRGGHNGDAEAAIEAERALEDVRRQLADTGVEHDVRQLVRGHDPAEDLVGVAEEVGAELIVIGLRRRTPVGKLILGSNAQRVLLDAHCPVLAVKSTD